MLEAISTHWPEYLIEAALLGLFMMSACACVACVQHPASPVSRRIASPVHRRIIIGVLMGVTAIALIYSPPGQRSGAHMNPGVTLTFLVLGKVRVWDALFYVVAQFAGGFMGVLVSRLTLGSRIRHERVNFVVTAPGPFGPRAAWLAEFVIAFIMTITVLWSSNHTLTAGYTGLFAGALVAVFIAVEAPFSGMSINPARTLGSALSARSYRGLWIYFTAPPLAMLCAAGLYTAAAGSGCVHCAKLDHGGPHPCIFNCTIDQMPGRNAIPASSIGIQALTGD